MKNWDKISPICERFFLFLDGWWSSNLTRIFDFATGGLEP